MFDFFKDKKVLVIVGTLLVLVLIFVLFIMSDNSNDFDLSDEIIMKEEKQEDVVSNFYIDVKGAVKDPGVYLVSDGERVIDAIEKAGGLSKNANTSNINLAKRLESEMVIVVYTNNEVKKGSVKSECDTECNCEVIEINNCFESESNVSKLININTATVDELMTLSGIGENKAKAIISYRKENGNFKTIDELKNVSGIGDSLFESIKDGITV